MIATILLILRLALSAALYAFIGWAFWLIWTDLRTQARLISNRQVPRLNLRYIGPAGDVEHKLETSPVTVGRDPACEILVDDQTVSNRHAQFSYHHSQWWITDLGSTNGTLLNGQSVTESVVLINGDLVQCGQVNLEVSIDQLISQRPVDTRNDRISG